MNSIANLTEKEIKVRLLISEAARWIGTKEEKENDGAFVRMFENWDNHPDVVPWCAAFVQYCLKMTCYTYDSLFECCSMWHNLAQSEHCMTMWAKTLEEFKTQVPEPGAIAIWCHNKNGVPTGAGHCGIVTGAKMDGNFFTTIEANTSDGSGINRNGEGVYQKVRNLAGTEGFQLLGFIKPWN